MTPPKLFRGTADGDSVKNFLAALENYFDLMKVNDSNQKARYAETLLGGKNQNMVSNEKF